MTQVANARIMREVLCVANWTARPVRVLQPLACEEYAACLSSVASVCGLVATSV